MIGNRVLQPYTTLHVHYDEPAYIERLHAPGKLEPGYEKIPMTCKKGLYYIDLVIGLPSGDSLVESVMLDMGCGASLILSGQSDRLHRLEEKVSPVRWISGNDGLGGGGSGFSFRTPFVRIGSFRIDRPIISSSGNQTGALATNSLLGNDFLDCFDVVIDFSKSELYLKPGKNFGKEFRFSVSGFSWIDRTDICDGWIVRHIDENGPAHRGGLLCGDTLIRINDCPVTGITGNEIKRWFVNGHTVRFTVGREGGIRQEIALQFSDDYAECPVLSVAK